MRCLRLLPYITSESAGFISHVTVIPLFDARLPRLQKSSRYSLRSLISCLSGRALWLAAAGLLPPSKVAYQLLHLEEEKLKVAMRGRRRIPMMTEDEIQTELGWTRSMIYSLLRAPDSDTARSGKTGGYACSRYSRERVLAVAQSPEGQAAQKRWDATLRGFAPDPGWTPRLGDIGRQLGITGVAAGRILDLMGYRSDGCVTNSAMAAGFGVPRWNDFTMQNDWHLDRVVSAIRSAAQSPSEPAIANALAAAIAKQQGRERVLARKRKHEEQEAAFRKEEEAVISGLLGELRALINTHPGISLLDAVEYTTCDPYRRIALYGRCSAEDRTVNGMGQDVPGLLKIAWQTAKELAQLERRARAEGFQVS
jgi:hypothetical protein